MYFSQEFPSLFSVKRANERRIFHGYKFAILSHSVLTPSKEILESIIKTGGGKLLGQIPSIKSLKQVKKLREEDPKSCHPGKKRFILCVRSYPLLDTWSDFDETWRVYRVHHALLYGAIFDFRFRPWTRSCAFPHNVIYVQWEKYFGGGHSNEIRYISLTNGESALYTPSKFHSNRFTRSGGSLA